jgi:hypothetical protein
MRILALAAVLLGCSAAGVDAPHGAPLAPVDSAGAPAAPTPPVAPTPQHTYGGAGAPALPSGGGGVGGNPTPAAGEPEGGQAPTEAGGGGGGDAGTGGAPPIPTCCYPQSKCDGATLPVVLTLPRNADDDPCLDHYRYCFPRAHHLDYWKNPPPPECYAAQPVRNSCVLSWPAPVDVDFCY